VDIVTLSSEFQVVIPRDVRIKQGLKPGQKIVVLEKDGILHIVSQRSLEETRGFVKGLDTEDLRDEDD